MGRKADGFAGAAGLPVDGELVCTGSLLKSSCPAAHPSLSGWEDDVLCCGPAPVRQI